MPISDEAMGDYETAVQLGFVPGVLTSEPYSCRWDPFPGSNNIDFGWGGEDSEGIWLKQHPKVVIAMMPRLWLTHDSWRYGRHELCAGDYDSLSSVELEIRATLQTVSNRSTERRLEQKQENNNNG